MSNKRLLGLLMTLLVLTSCGKSQPLRDPKPLGAYKAEASVEVVWKRRVGNGQGHLYNKLTPVYVNDRVFVAAENGLVQALDAKKGKVVWSVQLPDHLSGGIGYGAGRIVVGSSNGIVYALNENNGQRLWRRQLSSEIVSRPLVDFNLVLVHTNDSKLFAIGTNDGQIRWTYDRTAPPLSLRGESTPLVSQGTIFLGTANGKLAIIGLRDGDVKNEAPVVFATGSSDLERMVDMDSQPILEQGTLYVASFRGDLFALSLTNGGRILWSQKISTHSNLAHDNQNLFINGLDDVVYAVDKTTGRVIWKQEGLYGRLLSAPLSYVQYIVVGDSFGYLHVLSKLDGREVGRKKLFHRIPQVGKDFGPHQIQDPGLRAVPVYGGDLVYVYGNDGMLYAVKITGQ